MQVPNQFGDWFREARKQAGLTQGELAAKLQAHQPDISAYETGKHLPDARMRRAIEEVFQVAAGFVFRLVAETEAARTEKGKREETVPVTAQYKERGQSQANERPLSVDDAAAELGLTRRRVSKLCEQGRLGRRIGKRVYLITRAELDIFKAIPRKPGPKGKRKLATWSTVCDSENALIEVHAQFEHTPNWFGGKGNSKYVSLRNALCGKNGALPLFLAKGANKDFRKHGRCQFFAAAQDGANEIYATADGKVLCCINRTDLGGRRLADVSVEEMRRLCSNPETPRRAFEAL